MNSITQMASLLAVPVLLFAVTLRVKLGSEHVRSFHVVMYGGYDEEADHREQSRTDAAAPTRYRGSGHHRIACGVCPAAQRRR